MIDRSLRPRLEGLQIPERIISGIVSNGFDWNRSAIASGREKLRQHAPIVVIAGLSAVGKTSLASILASEARSRGRIITSMVTCGEEDDGAYQPTDGGASIGYWVRDVKSEVGARPLRGKLIHAPTAFDRIFESDFWSSIEKLEILILDDLGLEPQRKEVTSRIAGLLVARCNADRPTIVTTNLNLHDFRSTYCHDDPHDRIITRIGNGWIQYGGEQAGFALEAHA